MTVIENRMLSDISWNEIEYGVKYHRFRNEDEQLIYEKETASHIYQETFYEGRVNGVNYEVYPEDALQFAWEHLTEAEKRGIVDDGYTDDEIVEWFYSGGAWLLRKKGEEKF